jgi:hypothetical protein
VPDSEQEAASHQRSPVDLLRLANALDADAAGPLCSTDAASGPPAVQWSG